MPTQTIEEIYERDVVFLPLTDRLRLASLILRDLVDSPAPLSAADESTEWSEDNIRQWSGQSLRRFMHEEDNENADAAKW